MTKKKMLTKKKEMDQDSPFLVIQYTVQYFLLFVHTLKIYACDKSNAYKSKFEWLSDHMIKEPLRNMKVLQIAHLMGTQICLPTYREMSCTIVVPQETFTFCCVYSFITIKSNLLCPLLGISLYQPNKFVIL